MKLLNKEKIVSVMNRRLELAPHLLAFIAEIEDGTWETLEDMRRSFPTLGVADNDGVIIQTTSGRNKCSVWGRVDYRHQIFLVKYVLEGGNSALREELYVAN